MVSEEWPDGLARNGQVSMSFSESCYLNKHMMGGARSPSSRKHGNKERRDMNNTPSSVQRGVHKLGTKEVRCFLCMRHNRYKDDFIGFAGLRIHNVRFRENKRFFSRKT